MGPACPHIHQTPHGLPTHPDLWAARQTAQGGSPMWVVTIGFALDDSAIEELST